MSKAEIRYNERAWAIDVITEINIYCAWRHRAVVRAGGEHSIAGKEGSLFPDVLLFGDTGGSVVLQGWELKMPDTRITDSDLLKNAEQKAKRMKLNSFLVWNANDAALYLCDDKGFFQQVKCWPGIGLHNRIDVQDIVPHESAGFMT